MQGSSAQSCLFLCPRLGYDSGGRPCPGSLVGTPRSKQPDFPWARLPASLLIVNFPTQLYFFAQSLSALFTAWPLTPSCTLCTENSAGAKAFKRPLKGLKLVV